MADDYVKLDNFEKLSSEELIRCLDKRLQEIVMIKQMPFTVNIEEKLEDKEVDLLKSFRDEKNIL